jgi:uncharacterized protein (DUF927 family)
MNGAPDDSFCILADKIGWIAENAYVLPDVQFGSDLSQKIFFNGGDDNPHRHSGTLAEWQHHVGKYCQGNPLLVFAVSYALTGPLLKLCGIEGGGVHIYGKSSSGKSTCATVAGSACGGGGHRGYLRQWRATHNALENTASMHNDNLLILDEISQANPDTVSQVAYMLANGQGRERLKSDATKRQQYTWLLNFLSTGELTIDDKIEENGRYKALTGQTVRVIDLPIDEGTGANAFQELHGLKSSQNLSETLTRNSCRYYGTPLRAFLRNLCGKDMPLHITTLHKSIDRFLSENCPEGASGQVRRVLNKFALIAAAGELAVSFGILPFNHLEAWRSAGHWFKVWLNQRNGLGDRETMIVFKRIRDHFASFSQQYVKIDQIDSYGPPRLLGYTWKEREVDHYLAITPTVEELFRGANKRAMIEELARKGWLGRTSQGTVMHTKSVKGRSVRGLVFIPSSWENEE